MDQPEEELVPSLSISYKRIPPRKLKTYSESRIQIPIITEQNNKFKIGTDVIIKSHTVCDVDEKRNFSHCIGKIESIQFNNGFYYNIDILNHGVGIQVPEDAIRQKCQGEDPSEDIDEFDSLKAYQNVTLCNDDFDDDDMGDVQSINQITSPSTSQEPSSGECGKEGKRPVNNAQALNPNTTNPIGVITTENKPTDTNNDDEEEDLPLSARAAILTAAATKDRPIVRAIKRFNSCYKNVGVSRTKFENKRRLLYILWMRSSNTTLANAFVFEEPTDDILSSYVREYCGKIIKVDFGLIEEEWLNKDTTKSNSIEAQIVYNEATIGCYYDLPFEINNKLCDVIKPKTMHISTDGGFTWFPRKFGEAQVIIKDEAATLTILYQAFVDKNSGYGCPKIEVIEFYLYVIQVILNSNKKIKFHTMRLLDTAMAIFFEEFLNEGKESLLACFEYFNDNFSTFMQGIQVDYLEEVSKAWTENFDIIKMIPLFITTDSIDLNVVRTTISNWRTSVTAVPMKTSVINATSSTVPIPMTSSTGVPYAFPTLVTTPTVNNATPSVAPRQFVPVQIMTNGATFIPNPLTHVTMPQVISSNQMMLTSKSQSTPEQVNSINSGLGVNTPVRISDAGYNSQRVVNKKVGSTQILYNSVPKYVCHTCNRKTKTGKRARCSDQTCEGSKLQQQKKK